MNTDYLMLSLFFYHTKVADQKFKKVADQKFKKVADQKFKKRHELLLIANLLN